MKQRFSWKLTALLGGAMLVALTVAAAQSSSANPPAAPQVTAEQQKQLDQLQEQLQKDRDAVHAAITQYGWDSNQTDAAREQLFRDRAEYRKVRRSLRFAGVAVAPPAGMGQRAFRRGPGRNYAGCGAGHMRQQGRRHQGRMCRCPCGY